MLSLLSVLLMQAAAPMPVSAETADARCIFIFGFVGARGTPAQAEQAKLATMYFYGKLRGRNPGINMGKLLVSTRDQAKRSGIKAQIEGKRCESEFKAAGMAFVSGAAAAKTAPPANRAPTPRKP